MPVAELLSAGYAEAAPADRPKRPDQSAAAADAKSDTVYLSVVDRDRNAVGFINSTLFVRQRPGRSRMVLQNRGSVSASIPSTRIASRRANDRCTIMPGMAMKAGASDALRRHGWRLPALRPRAPTTNILDFAMDPQTALDPPRVL